MIRLKIERYLQLQYPFLQTRRIYVFGAGHIGHIVTESLLKLGLGILNVIDNNPEKENSFVEGIPVCSFGQYLKSRSDADLIIVAMENYKEVMQQVENAGVSKYKVLAICKEIEDDAIFRAYIISEFYDINLQLQKEALAETAQFVKENMFHVPQYRDRSEMLRELVRQAPAEGLVLEFGVFEGQTLNWIASWLPQKEVYGFDSFEGLPEDWIPSYGKGKFAVRALPKVKENVKLIKGWFDQTLPGFLQEHRENCSFVHIDCDLYSSTKVVFEMLKERIVEGTVIVFDEFFNHPNWQHGEFKAFMEFIQDTGREFEYLGYVPTGSQVGVRIGPKTLIR